MIYWPLLLYQFLKIIKVILQTAIIYRRISPCSASCKAVDLFILVTCADKLTSSDYQYAFTVMCTLILKETVDYCLSNNSNVHACMLDARKAFDRLHYGKLFNILLERNSPSIVSRLLLILTTTMCYSLNGISICQSQFIQKGVKQGAI